jgi:hypothetical protein
MKKITKTLAIALCSSLFLSSCYSYTSVVGKGPQGATKVSKWNHYVIEGLIPVGVSDAQQMASGSQDYSVHTRQTFANGLVSILTFGIYTPSTTTVTK